MLRFRVRQQGLTPIELVVIVVVTATIVSLLVAFLSSRRERAYRARCASNLSDIYRLAAMYADKGRASRLRVVPAHSSLQKLVDRFPRECRPEMFVCPSSDAVRALITEAGRFVLDGGTNAYAWEGGSRRTAKIRPVASDKFIDGYEDREGRQHGHSRGMNVLITDGSVEFWSLDGLEEDTGLPAGLVR